MIVRKAEIEDAAQIAGIYNYYIENSHHTFETEPLSSAEMQKRVSEIAADYPFIVAEENNRIIGYSYSSQYKSRCAYKNTVEISVYVQNNAKQKGVGTMLYTKLFDELSKLNVHAIIAGIALPNDASIKLHEKFGMEKVAHFREVGYKFGKWIDVGYWELINKK